MRRQIGATVLAITMACSLVAGCSSGPGETTAVVTEVAKKESKEEAKDGVEDEAEDILAETENIDPEEGNGKKYVIGPAIDTQTNPFFVDIKNGVQKAADEHSIELYITDAQDDPTIQIENVEDLITKKPDAIIIDTCNPDAIVSSIGACDDAGIPVLTMNHKANGSKVISHIGYDTVKSGHMAGQYLADVLDGKGKIVETQGIMGINAAQNHSQGPNEVMKGNPDVEVVACRVADFDRAKGMSIMENIFQVNPEIDGLYAANDEMLLGTLEATGVTDKIDKIVKIGYDTIDDILGAMKIGGADATIAEPPFFLGRTILSTAYDYLEDKQVGPHVILDNQLVTQGTVDSLVAKE